MTLHYAIGQIIGERETQEDFCGVQSGRGDAVQSDSDGWKQGSPKTEVIAVLCDGMGGHNAGEIAAQTAAITFLKVARDNLTDQIKDSQALLTACHEANRNIAQQVLRDSSLSGMGTTLVGVRCTADSLSWVSVGDSHLLLLRNRHLVKLNQDHSMRPVLEQMVSKGIISQEEANSHPERNALRSALTGDKIGFIDLGVERLTLRPRDTIVIASDGIDVLRNDVVQGLLSVRFQSLSKIAMNIVLAAKRYGGREQDNTSVILIYVQ